MVSDGKKLPNTYPKKKRTTANVVKVRSLILKENPATQRSVAKSIKCALSTVNKIINSDLSLKKAKKFNVHRLLPKHIADRKTRCRKLYENHLSGEKWKNVVTIDESWVYLSDCDKKRAVYYRKRGEKMSKHGFTKAKKVLVGDL